MANVRYRSTIKADLSIEARFAPDQVVCGVDEAGRGPWAGPVAVAAVVLTPGGRIEGLNDSKTLSAKERERLYGMICDEHQVGVAFASVRRIDATNIRAATLWAMRQAILSLPVVPDVALVDGRDLPPRLPCYAEALIKGDSRSQSIAAASIIAKVSRDRLMCRFAETAPGYGFEHHMGYGVRAHAEALSRLGVTELHRRSFRPVADRLAQSFKPGPAN